MLTATTTMHKTTKQQVWFLKLMWCINWAKKYWYHTPNISYTSHMLMGMWTQHLCKYTPKHNLKQLLFHMLLSKCTRNNYAHQIGYIGRISQIPDMHMSGMYAPVYDTYDVTGINNATRTAVHIFIKYHWTKLAVMFQIYLTWPTCYMNI